MQKDQSKVDMKATTKTSKVYYDSSLIWMRTDRIFEDKDTKHGNMHFAYLKNNNEILIVEDLHGKEQVEILGRARATFEKKKEALLKRTIEGETHIQNISFL